MYKLLLIEPPLTFAETEPPQEVVVDRTDASRRFQVVQTFSPRLVVADAPAEVPGLESRESVESAPLNDAERLAASAWLEGTTPSAQPPPAPKKWNAFGGDAPKFFRRPAASGLLEAPDNGGLPLTAERSMHGRIAVGVVFVSGAFPGLLLSESDRRAVLSDVQQGLQLLATAELKARVLFAYDVQHVTVQVPPGTVLPGGEEEERLEAPWRDAALTALGYGPGKMGWGAYASAIRASLSARWSYVAFFTRYKLHHYAYTVDDKVVMYAGPLEPTRLQQVFAHETCHVFGAADEYGNCSCNSRHGVFQARNGNCRACPTPQRPCLMNMTAFVLCSHSRKQLGWDEPNVA
jgi:hypothetical protein